jgi:hypothetical protein
MLGIKTRIIMWMIVVDVPTRQTRCVPPAAAINLFIFVAAMCRYASRARNDTLGCTHRVSRENYTFDGVAKKTVDVTRETQMEFDDFPNYLDRLREKREKADRERDLEVKLQRIAERHREVPVAE